MDQHVFPIVLKVARHEAGHYFAGRVLGFRSDGFAVTFHDSHAADYSGTAGIYLNSHLPTVESIADYAERRVQVLFAGAWAESLGLGTGRVDEPKAKGYLEKNGAFDAAKAREQLQLLLSLRYGRVDDDERSNELIQAIWDELWAKTRHLVEQEYRSIEGIAMNLAQRVKDSGIEYKLTNAEINALKGVRDRFGLA